MPRIPRLKSEYRVSIQRMKSQLTIISSFINHYIFPGGYLPSVTQLLNHISTESKGTLIVENVENIGGHYSKALRLWKEEFLAKFEDKIRPALKKEHKGMTDEEMDVFRRKWEVSTIKPLPPD